MTYALGIYLLNLFIGFLSPRIDPAMIEDQGKVIFVKFFGAIFFQVSCVFRAVTAHY